MQEPQERNYSWFGWKESEAEQLMKINLQIIFDLILLIREVRLNSWRNSHIRDKQNLWNDALLVPEPKYIYLTMLIIKQDFCLTVEIVL